MIPAGANARARSMGTVALAVALATAAWVSFGTLAIVDASGIPVGVLPSVWLLLVLALIALPFLVYSERSGQIRSTLALPLLLLLPWLPLRIPSLFLAWTGPIALFVWGSVAMAILFQVVRRRARPWLALYAQPLLAPWFAAAFAFVAFFSVHFNAVGPPGGDEPHYLVITQSILKDGDIRVENNY